MVLKISGCFKGIIVEIKTKHVWLVALCTRIVFVWIKAYNISSTRSILYEAEFRFSGITYLWPASRDFKICDARLIETHGRLLLQMQWDMFTFWHKKIAELYNMFMTLYMDALFQSLTFICWKFCLSLSFGFLKWALYLITCVLKRYQRTVIISSKWI